MSVIHISGAEAASNVAALLAQVRAGAEVVIEDGLQPPIAMSLIGETGRRTTLESRALAKSHSENRDYDALMDAAFAANSEDCSPVRKPRDAELWD